MDTGCRRLADVWLVQAPSTFPSNHRLSATTLSPQFSSADSRLLYGNLRIILDYSKMCFTRAVILRMSMRLKQF